jgi:hypothetical protein
VFRFYQRSSCKGVGPVLLMKFEESCNLSEQLRIFLNHKVCFFSSPLFFELKMILREAFV